MGTQAAQILESVHLFCWKAPTSKATLNNFSAKRQKKKKQIKRVNNSYLSSIEIEIRSRATENIEKSYHSM